ncbi:MAG: uncharacterized protein A8A55_0340 [Amphiamblys sp. WSBS2006]|nr:MAG: uncharacterized protein A8A55_0340 [Amphiamblys sp. WSBS2006]
MSTDKKGGELRFLGMRDGELACWGQDGGRTPCPLLKTGGKKFVLAPSHSSAFVDINGDSISDLFLVCSEESGLYGETFLNTPDGFEYKKEKRIKLPDTAGPVTFADTRGSGSFDCIVGYNEGNEGKVAIYENMQREIKIGYLWDTRGGKRVEVREPDSVYGYSVESRNKEIEKLNIPGQIAHENKGIPLFIRAIDVNKEGYPGLFVPVVSDSSTKYIFLSRVKAGYEIPESMAWTGEIVDAVGVGLFDLRKSEEKCLVISYRGEGGLKHSVREIKGGNLGLMLNVFSGTEKKGLGSYFGATTKYAVCIEGEDVKYHAVAHGEQTASFCNSNSERYVGLGSGQSFIEKFFFSVSDRRVERYIYNGGIVPNNKIFLFVSGEKVHPLISPYHSPYYNYAIWGVMCGALCFFLISQVFYLRELQEDKRERQKTVYIMNYDAL